jgi:hypothetical protein
MYNTLAHRRGLNLELRTLTEVQKFSKAIFEAPDDDHLGQIM